MMREPSPPRPSTVSGRASLTEAQFAELYPGLRRFAGAIGAPVVDADDLVQEACVRYMRRTGTEPVTDVGAYLRRTMLNAPTPRKQAPSSAFARSPREARSSSWKNEIVNAR